MTAARPRVADRASTPCPCDTGRPYAACCGRWHRGPLAGQAPDPVSLMRSRYSAFVLDERDYLLQTWHPSTRPRALASPEPGLRWLGLSVRRHEVQGETGVVEFVARSKLAGRASRLHEVRRFVLEGGRWYYLDGKPGGDSGGAGD